MTRCSRFLPVLKFIHKKIILQLSVLSDINFMQDISKLSKHLSALSS